MSANIVTSDPEILGGTPVFTGTRVPVAVLFENLADGLTLDEILDSYPTLTREKALAALQQAESLLELKKAACCTFWLMSACQSSFGIGWSALEPSRYPPSRMKAGQTSRTANCYVPPMMLGSMSC